MCYLYERTFQSTGRRPAPLNTCYSFYNYADKSEVVTMILGCFLNQIFLHEVSLCCLNLELKSAVQQLPIPIFFAQQQNFQLIS